jgi:hypothetical protein
MLTMANQSDSMYFKADRAGLRRMAPVQSTSKHFEVDQSAFSRQIEAHKSGSMWIEVLSSWLIEVNEGTSKQIKDHQGGSDTGLL